MEGINPQRMAMIANTPAPREPPATTNEMIPAGTESNNIPLGAPRRGPRLENTVQESSTHNVNMGPPANILRGAYAAPGNTTSYNNMSMGNGTDDDKMDDDSDDEADATFSLDRPSAQDAEMPFNHANQMLSPTGYCQSFEPFSGFGTQDLWLPPVDDLAFVLIKYRVKDPVRVFHSACMKIRKNWDCAPSQCLPPDLRRTTPYSLVMLRKLALLSTATPSGGRGVQELLFAQAADRVSRLPMPAPDSQGLRIVQSPGQKDAEDRILENVEGLMLDDVDNILWEMRKGSVSRLPIGDDASGSLRSLIQASVDLKARKEARRENRRAIRQQRKADPAAEPRVSRDERRLLHQQQVEAARERKLAKSGAHGADHALAQQLTKLGVDRASPVEAHRKDRRQRQKASLQRGLPSERLQNASMPSLHLLAEARDERATLQGMSLLGLGVQQPLPPLTVDRVTDETDEDDGGVSLLGQGTMTVAHDNGQVVGQQSHSIDASQSEHPNHEGPRRAPGTRCPECFRLHRKCTHTNIPTGPNNVKGISTGAQKARGRGGRGRGRGGHAEHVGPRHGEVVGADAAAMGADNFGHRMMEKMGWSQGTALGKDGEGVLTPLEQRMRQGKAGLG